MMTARGVPSLSVVSLAWPLVSYLLAGIAGIFGLT